MKPSPLPMVPGPMMPRRARLECRHHLDTNLITSAHYPTRHATGDGAQGSRQAIPPTAFSTRRQTCYYAAHAALDALHISDSGALIAHPYPPRPRIPQRLLVHLAISVICSPEVHPWVFVAVPCPRRGHHGRGRALGAAAAALLDAGLDTVPVALLVAGVDAAQSLHPQAHHLLLSRLSRQLRVDVLRQHARRRRLTITSGKGPTACRSGIHSHNYAAPPRYSAPPAGGDPSNEYPSSADAQKQVKKTTTGANSGMYSHEAGSQRDPYE